MRPRRTIFAVALRRQLREFRKDRDRVHNFLLRLTSIIVLGVVAQWSAWRSPHTLDLPQPGRDGNQRRRGEIPNVE